MLLRTHRDQASESLSDAEGTAGAYQAAPQWVLCFFLEVSFLKGLPIQKSLFLSKWRSHWASGKGVCFLLQTWLIKFPGSFYLAAKCGVLGPCLVFRWQAQLSAQLTWVTLVHSRPSKTVCPVLWDIETEICASRFISIHLFPLMGGSYANAELQNLTGG